MIGKWKNIRKRNAYSREFSSTSTRVQADAEPIMECVWSDESRIARILSQNLSFLHRKFDSYNNPFRHSRKHMKKLYHTPQKSIKTQRNQNKMRFLHLLKKIGVCLQKTYHCRSSWYCKGMWCKISAKATNTK